MYTYKYVYIRMCVLWLAPFKGVLHSGVLQVAPSGPYLWNRNSYAFAYMYVRMYVGRCVHTYGVCMCGSLFEIESALMKSSICVLFKVIRTYVVSRRVEEREGVYIQGNRETGDEEDEETGVATQL